MYSKQKVNHIYVWRGVSGRKESNFDATIIIYDKRMHFIGTAGKSHWL